MTVTRLASTADVEAALGRELTSGEQGLAEFALDKASEAFRREAGQTFTPAESTVRLKALGGVVTLPQRPAVDVSAVADDDGNAVEFTLDGQRVVLDADALPYVAVTYEHGGDVPDLVRLAVAEVVARNLRIDDDAKAGKTQFSNTAGPFTESGAFATWAVGGQVMLSPDDKALARSYRRPQPRVYIQNAPGRW